MIEQDCDRTLGFVIKAQDAQGRVARVGPALDRILAAHDYPAPVRQLLAEALVLTALLGATLKESDGQMTLQAQTDGGPVELLVCDYHGGALRGYVKYDAERIAALPASPLIADLFGRGYLAITFDQTTTGERYQGIVPLEGASLADAAEHYFAQSEQIPSLVRIAVRAPAGAEAVAGGLLVQHLPEGEVGRERLHARVDAGRWQHVRTLAQTVTADELTDRSLPSETLLWRLFGREDEVTLTGGAALTRGCRCNRAHIVGVLSRFPATERADMAVDGAIDVDCAFCSTIFRIPLDEMENVSA